MRFIRLVRHEVAQIGEGKQAYDNAKDFVKSWKHMDLGWVDTNRPPVEVRKPHMSWDIWSDPGIWRHSSLLMKAINCHPGAGPPWCLGGTTCTVAEAPLRFAVEAHNGICTWRSLPAWVCGPCNYILH